MTFAKDIINYFSMLLIAYLAIAIGMMLPTHPEVSLNLALIMLLPIAAKVLANRYL